MRIFPRNFSSDGPDVFRTFPRYDSLYPKPASGCLKAVSDCPKIDPVCLKTASDCLKAASLYLKTAPLCSKAVSGCLKADPVFPQTVLGLFLSFFIYFTHMSNIINM